MNLFLWLAVIFLAVAVLLGGAAISRARRAHGDDWGTLIGCAVIVFALALIAFILAVVGFVVQVTGPT